MTIKEAVDKAILEHANKGRDDDTSLSEFICRKLEVLAGLDPTKEFPTYWLDKLTPAADIGSGGDS